jgi:hypothetical protein
MVVSLVACAPRSARIMTWLDYSRRQVRWPYVVKIDSGNGHLFYFGAEHAYSPSHPQFETIENAWLTFHPDIAFTEGGSPPFETSREEAIRKAGEPGFVRFLAARDNVPTTTLDPSRAEEVVELSKRFSREQIKLCILLRLVMQFVERTGGIGVESELDRLLSIYSSTPGLLGSPRTPGEVQELYGRYFPGHGGYAGVPKKWFDPAEQGTFFNEISRASSEYRDRKIVRLLAEHVEAGERVFAVIGGSHVVMQEPALRGRLRVR